MQGHLGHVPLFFCNLKFFFSGFGLDAVRGVCGSAVARATAPVEDGAVRAGGERRRVEGDHRAGAGDGGGLRALLRYGE